MDHNLYECENCVYWELMHKVGSHSYRDGELLKCARCTRPIREQLIEEKLKEK